MQTTIQTYKFSELYKKYGEGISYRSFQRTRSEYVEVLVTVGKKIQKRYLDKSDSLFVIALKNIIL